MKCTYVCKVCLGVGVVFQPEPELDTTIIPCGSCSEKGFPPFIIANGGKGPGASELTIETTLSVFVPPELTEKPNDNHE